MPAKDWYDELDSIGRGEFRACMDNIATCWTTNRGSERLEILKNTANRWLEVRITVRGKKGRPTRRALGHRHRMTLWLAVGFVKDDKIDKRHIDQADGVLDDWIGENQ